MPTREILDYLIGLVDRPWGEWKGKPLSPQGLAAQLRRFDIHPLGKTHREGADTFKGYGASEGLPRGPGAHLQQGPRGDAGVHTHRARRDPLARACLPRVAPLKVTKDRRLPFYPLTVEQAKDLAKQLQPHHARTLWAFCLTGMRPEEFEEIGNPWEVETDGIRVHGTMSPAADRVVPRLGLLVKPGTKRLAFYRALRTASGETVTPYDLRRTYAQWLDLARVPRFRQAFYMGHGPKDITALYQRMREVTASLKEDAAALEQLVGQPVLLRIVK
jgi:integrase